jgi:hypothetical protein
MEEDQRVKCGRFRSMGFIGGTARGRIEQM